jgi:modulator of FtsH protease
MQPETPMMAQRTASLTPALARNRVLRNTYLLLAISLVPTILGAWIGVQLNFGLALAMHPAIGFLAFMAVAVAFIFGIERTKNSGMGVALLLGFTFVMGLMLSQILGLVLGMANGWNLIALAFGGTALVFAAMAAVGTTTKRDLSGLGKFLFIGLVMLIVASFANIFLHLAAMTIVLSLIAIGIFSAFMMYDVNRIVTGGETNYITATLALYLDVYNVFVNLLALLGFANSDR